MIKVRSELEPKANYSKLVSCYVTQLASIKVSVHGVPVTGTFPPGSFHPCGSPRFFPPRKFPSDVKYAVDANLFRLESPNPNVIEASYKPEQRRGGSVLPGVKNPRGGNFRGERP